MWVLIASVPDLCILFTFSKQKIVSAFPFVDSVTIFDPMIFIAVRLLFCTVAEFVWAAFICAALVMVRVCHGPSWLWTEISNYPLRSQKLIPPFRKKTGTSLLGKYSL